MPRSKKSVYNQRRKSRQGKARVPKPLKSYIKKAISRNIETKQSTLFGLNQDILTVASSTPTAINLLPTPTQGTGESDRLGNLIDVKKLVVHGMVNLKPYDAITNPNVAPGPLWVKIWIVSAKNVNTNTFSNTSAASSFFASNNSSVNFQATVRDMLLDVNNDLFTLHRYKMFKLGASGSSSVVNPTTYYDNSPAAATFRFDLSKLVGRLRFDENQTWATNKNLFLVISTCRADGSTGSATVAQCEYHWKCDVMYKDA